MRHRREAGQRMAAKLQLQRTPSAASVKQNLDEPRQVRFVEVNSRSI
jgi:hypothetical protein